MGIENEATWRRYMDQVDSATAISRAERAVVEAAVGWWDSKTLAKHDLIDAVVELVALREKRTAMEEADGN
jgi:hypothetical protein